MKYNQVEISWNRCTVGEQVEASFSIYLDTASVFSYWSRPGTRRVNDVWHKHPLYSLFTCLVISQVCQHFVNRSDEPINFGASITSLKNVGGKLIDNERWHRRCDHEFFNYFYQFHPIVLTLFHSVKINGKQCPLNARNNLKRCVFEEPTKC